MPTTSYLLTWMTFTPLIGVGLIFALLALKKVVGPGLVTQGARAIALLASAVDVGLGLWLWRIFDSNAAGPQFVHHFVWMKQFNIEYFVGVDGVSISMVILTVLIAFVAAIASVPWWGHKEPEHHGEGEKHVHFSEMKVPGYMAMLLILETGMVGVFVSLDFFLFYVFWELMLLPMYFLIGIWGGPRKEYAAIKFFLYTLAGSVLMLLAIIAMYYNTGDGRTAQFALVDGTRSVHTFNMLEWARLGQAGHWMRVGTTILGMAFPTAMWVAFFIGFAIKVPMFPFHTWLPDAHVEAPTPISVILAGVLLKMGIYGMLRVNWAMLPQTTREMAYVVAVFGVINIVYAALVCMAQKDLKRLIAYSSVSHMGFCLLGMAAMTPQGITGAVFNLWTHGLISPMLFLIAGVIYDRAHHREINGFGGLAKALPEYTGVMGLAFFASLGLPGLAGFVSEFLVFSGAFRVFTVLTIVSATSVVITAAYYLWTIQRMFLGKLNPKYAALPDLSWRERVTLYPLGAMVILFGFYPHPILGMVSESLKAFVGN
ncbi:MAG: NADH-quinone oxidoreductase subunit M [Deltaproteobacteria bacterium]|nr:NADH-quinone oxidoreductase subunit M [Deltaproteobacteria bacterium]